MTGIIEAHGGPSGYLKARYRRLKAAGLCVRCAKRRSESFVVCNACRAREVKQARERAAFKQKEASAKGGGE